MPTPRRGRGARAPGPVSRIPGRTLLAFTRDPLGFLARLAERHGHVAGFRAGFRHVYLLSHPDLVHKVLVADPDDFPSDQGLGMSKVLLGEGLLTTGGEKYRRHRLLIQPSFQRDRVEAYAGVMVRHALARQDRWQDGAEVDLGREMASIALAIVAEALLGTRVSEEQIAEVTDSLDDAMATLTMARIPVHELLARLPLPSSRKLRRARDRIDAVVHSIIAARRSGRPGDDLLSRLLHGHEADGRAGMSADELRDEVTTLLLTGHETVATALTWTFYLLGRHPDEEARLHEELDSVLDARTPELADLRRLPRLEGALLESMRLYPPAWTVARGVARPFDARGYRIPPGSVVLLSQWVMHRHPAWFADPLRFDPDRWGSHRRGEIPRLAYFPFGAGPRVCIGETFAWNEAALVTATLARRWRFELVQGEEVAPVARLTLRPGRRIPVVTRRRTRT